VEQHSLSSPVAQLERLAWHPMRMLLTRTPHPLDFRKVFGHAPANIKFQVEKR
jgi:hypothetical protein